MYFSYKHCFRTYIIIKQIEVFTFYILHNVYGDDLRLQ